VTHAAQGGRDEHDTTCTADEHDTSCTAADTSHMAIGSALHHTMPSFPLARTVWALLLLLSNVMHSAHAITPSSLGEFVKLRGKGNTTVTMPSVGAGSMGGCSPDGPFPGGVPCKQYNATLMYLKNGGRSLHDALSYCNQYGTGQAVKDSKVPRSQVFMMSMVPYHLLGYNNTKLSVAASLDQLQVSYIDLVMVHHRACDISGWPRNVCQMKAFPDVPSSPDGKSSVWPAPACSVTDPTWQTCQDETWRALVELRNDGKIRAIGVSNWQIRNLQRMVDLGLELPATNQVEAHIGYVEDDLLSFCKEHGIVVQAATPLGRSMPDLVKPGADPLVTSIAQKYKKSPAQVSLRFLLDKGISPIPSASTMAYQQENLNLHDFSLTVDEVAGLSRLTPTCRGEWFMGLQKCWADPSTLMCMFKNGSRFHCP